LNEEIKKLWRRVQLVVGRGRITTTDDSGSVQKVQIKIGELETRDTTPRVAEYGFTSNPLEGCHGVVVFVGGDRSNGVIIGTNDQQARLKNLKRGEVAIYDDQGQSVWLKRTGIEINGAGLPITTLNFTMLAGGAANWGAGGAGTMSFNNMTVTYTGGSITHNGHRIDDQLRVTGVVAGGANSGVVV
jgi:phage baseplate assembly protein V